MNKKISINRLVFFLVVLTLISNKTFAQYPLSKDGYLNINTHQYSWVNVPNSNDTIARVYIDRWKMFKPLVIGTYTFAGRPSAATFGGAWVYTSDSLKMYYSNGTSWIDISIAGGGSIVDSAVIVGNGLIKSVSTTTITIKADTSTSLTGLTTLYQSGLKVNYTDTSTMLSKYLRRSDTTAMLANYARSISVVKYTDTASMLTNYARSISVVKYTDTASMLSTYARKNFISANAPLAYNNTTGVISADTTTSVTGLATKAFVLNNSGGGGSGTVTSIAAGLGMNFTTITTSGSIIADTSVLMTLNSVQNITKKKTFADTVVASSNVNLSGLVFNAGAGAFDIVISDTSNSGKLYRKPLASLISQGGNAFGASLSIGTTDNHDITFIANGAVALTLYASNGHVAFGTGSGGNPTQTFYVPGTSRFDGAFTIGANSGFSISSGVNFSSSAANNSPSGYGFYWGMNNPYGSGLKSHMLIKGDATMTTGTDTVVQADIIPTYNNSGAGTYYMIGIRYRPVLTSMTGSKNVAWDNEGGTVFNKGVLSATGTPLILTHNSDSSETQLTIGNGLFASSGALTNTVSSVSSAGTLTLATTVTDYVFSGTTTTWTLPAVSGNTNVRYRIKNRGSGAITLNSSGGGNDIYNTSAVATITINPGEAYILVNDGTFWNIE